MFHTSVFNRAAIACAALIITALPLAANAGEVNNRIHNEQARINQGVSSGQLTRGEYMNVETRLQRINANRRRDLRANGGRLTVAGKTQPQRARESPFEIPSISTSTTARISRARRRRRRSSSEREKSARTCNAFYRALNCVLWNCYWLVP